MAGLSSAITASAAQPLVLLLSLLLLTATISLSVFLELYPKPPMLRWIVLEWLFDTSNMFDMAADVDSSPLLLDVPPQANATTAADAPLPSLSTIVTHCLGVPPPARVTTAAAAAAADWVRSSERFSPSGFRRNVRTLFPCGQAPLGASAAAKLRAHNMLYVHDELDRFCRAGRFTNSTQLAIFFSDDTPPRDSPLPLVVKTRPIGFNSSAVLLPFETDRYYSGALLSSATLVPWARKHDSLVWRGSTTGYGLRRDFVHELAGHARSDIDVRFSGVVQGRSQWTRGGDYVAPPMSRRQLLQHRYLLSLEGNDIGSNLAWMLGHNSVVVMPTPTWENWLLHGLLRPWVHYVPVASPADVPVVLRWMRSHEAACMRIAANANAWVAHLLARGAATTWYTHTCICSAAGGSQICHLHLPTAPASRL